jgi:hypothetical protein
MTHLRANFGRSALPLLLVLCLAAFTATSVYAGGQARPLPATDLLGSPDAAVNGKFAVGSASVGSKALTVTGVIDFLGAGTVHNYFTQGGGNNMQINTNVDEANAVGDATKSQWKLVLGSSLDWFSIRRSPAGGTYNEDALFFIQGSTGKVGIATVDTSNGASIPFTPAARLHVETDAGTAVFGHATAAAGNYAGVLGRSDSTAGYGLAGWTAATTGLNYAVIGETDSSAGYGVYGVATSSTGVATGVFGESDSTSGWGVAAWASASTGDAAGVWAKSEASSGTGVFGWASRTSGTTYGVCGQSDSPGGRGVAGYAVSGTGTAWGVYGESAANSGTGVYGLASSTTGITYGVFGRAVSTFGYGVYYQGGLAGTGIKSAIVETQDYGWRHLYAMESPQNWFEDFGQATLTAGEAVVSIEPIFAQTVNLNKPYHVFLTPRGDYCSLYVANASATSFTVRAKEGDACETAFDYRIIAPRLDYEDLRLRPAEDPLSVEASLSLHSHLPSADPLPAVPPRLKAL